MTDCSEKLRKKAEAAIRKWALLEPGEGLLCAVSGGADSMCLLSVLTELGHPVTAAHYNHHLRAVTAQRDEDFVGDWCDRQGIPLVCGGGDVIGAAKANGWTVEEAARNLRQHFLEETANRLDLARIATAHHAGDNAETVLMRLARGSGLRGLRGIAPVRLPYIRPLLLAERPEIQAYLRERGIPWVEDESNDDTAMTRNRFRRDILPRFLEENPRFLEQLLRQGETLAREDEYLDALAAERLDAVKATGEGLSLPLAALRTAPEALRPRMLRLLLEELGGLRDISRSHLDSLGALVLEDGPGAQLSLPGGLLARREGGTLHLSRQDGSHPALLLLPGQAGDWGGYRVSCEKKERENSQRGHTIALCYDKIDWPLTIDGWKRDGGLCLSRGRRSLKRLLHDAGFSPAERQNVPVVYTAGECVAVPGIGVDERYRPQPGRENITLIFQPKDKEKNR